MHIKVYNNHPSNFTLCDMYVTGTENKYHLFLMFGITSGYILIYRHRNITLKTIVPFVKTL